MKSFNKYSSLDKLSLTQSDFLIEKLNNNFKNLFNNIKSHSNDDDMKKLELKLVDILNSYKVKIISGEIKTVDETFIKNIQKNIDNNIIEKLNIDIFFRGIKNLKGKDKKIEKYFNEYIKTIPKRLKTLFTIDHDVEDFDLDTDDIYYNPYDDSDDDEFSEWRKVASTAPKFRINRKNFEYEKSQLQIELLKMVNYLSENNKKVIVILEGRDAASKGSFIKTITENLKPSSFKINTFGIPTEAEKKNWFKRYEDVLPSEGQIAFYDRSWYNRAVIEPVMGYCTKEQYDNFMKDVVPFEEKLIKEGYYLIKFWFSITNKTQELRFKLRKTSPVKYWKFSPNDEKSREKWDIITTYKEEMFKKTSTEISPWIAIDSNDKRMSKLNGIRYILNQIPYENKKTKLLDVYPEIVFPIL
jgi:polyphosphate kinase 2